MIGRRESTKPYNVKLEMSGAEAILLRDALQHFGTSILVERVTTEQLRAVMLTQLLDILS